MPFDAKIGITQLCGSDLPRQRHSVPPDAFEHHNEVECHAVPLNAGQCKSEMVTHFAAKESVKAATYQQVNI